MIRKDNFSKIFNQIVIPLTLCTLAFIFYFWLLTKDFLIPGIDGPYYLIQVEAILERGEMVYGDPPFIFYLAALFATLCGNVRMGVAIAVSLMISLTCFPAYWLFTRLSKNIFPAIIGSILLVFSPQMVRLSGDLMKNAAGVFFLILSIYYVLLASSNWRLKNYIPAILSIFFTFLTHSLDAALSLFFAITCLIGVVIYYGRESKIHLRNLFAVISSAALLILITSIAFPYHFSDVNKGIAFIEDVIFSSPSNSQLPSVFRPKPARTWPSVSFFEIAYVLPFFIAGFILLIEAYRRKSNDRFMMLFSAIFMALLCIFPTILGLREWAWRFMLMSFIPISFIVGSISLDDNKVNLIAILIIVASFILIQTANATFLVRPTMSMDTYHDLLEIKEIMTDNASYRIAYSKGWSRYWPEYLFGRRLEDSKVTYLIIPKDAPPPPPFWRLIYEGKTLNLYRINK